MAQLESSLSRRQPLQSIQFGTIVEDKPNGEYTICLNDLPSKSMRVNKWKEKRMETGHSVILYKWNGIKGCWKPFATRNIKSTNPTLKTRKIQIQARYSVSFCKKIEGKKKYIAKKRNHSSFVLSLINLKDEADIGHINEMINVMNKLIQQDVSKSYKNGELVYKKSNEIKKLFNKASFPYKYKI